MKIPKTKLLVRKAFHEVYEMTPRAVVNTWVTKGEEQAKKQRIAIALTKARLKGARIPKR